MTLQEGPLPARFVAVPREGTQHGVGRYERFAPAIYQGSIVVALALGVGIVASAGVELFFQLAALPVVAVLFIRGAKYRLAISILGALVVFQSELTVLKYAYIVLVFLCFVKSLRALAGPDGGIRREYVGLVLGGTVLIGYLLCSLAVAKANGTPFESWFRDVLSYLLIAMLPIIGIDAGREIPVAWSRMGFLVLGSVGSVAMAIDWLERRGVSALPVGRFLLPSTVMVALCFTYALTLAAVPGTRFSMRVCCTAAATIIAGSMIISGMRSATLVLLVGLLGVIGVSRKMQVAPLRALVILGSVLTALVVLVPPLARFAIADRGFLDARIDGVLDALQGNVATDQSFIARDLSYKWTNESFFAHPLLGTGPGYLYQTPDHPTVMTFTLDAPGIVPAKFGILGVVVILAFLGCILMAVRSIRGNLSLPFYTAARGWLVILVVLIPFGPWPEDKGFALALAMLFAGIGSEIRDYTRRDASEPVTGSGRT